MTAQVDRFVHDRLPPPDQLPIFRYDLPELQLPDQLNLVEELLDKAPAKGFANNPMLRSPTRTLTYAEAAREVNRIAQVLTEDLHLVPGNRVLLRGGNSIQMALSWLAVVKAGLIAVATMPLLRAKELGDIIEKSQPVAALCDGKLLAELEAAREAHPVLKTVLAFHQPDSATPDNVTVRSICSHSRGMNPTMAGIMGVFQIAWVYYGLLIVSRPVIVWNTIGVVINFVNVGAYLYFVRKARL